jgi:HAD superfamily hydrolase (TIGR01509 family)
MVKYIILDFGKVLAYPTTGYWQITPKFLKLVNINKIDNEKLKDSMKEHKGIISCGLIIKNCEEEYKHILEFYEKVLQDIKVDNYKDIAKEIAYNFVYEFDKYQLYDGVKEELQRLSQNYKLILLSDNWPSVISYMKHNEIYDYFEKVYVSSIYGQKKKNGLFFDNPINDFNIKYGEAIFIDDNENLLDVAVTKGL